MRTLTIIRHAKSDWTHDVSDHQRPLNKRGKYDLPIVADRLNQLNCKPNMCYYSTARRAADTANGILDYMNIGVPREATDLLYTFDAFDLINFLKTVDKHIKHVMIVSHNPGLTELINRISRVKLDNLPTCGFAQFKFDMAWWTEIDVVEGEMVFLEYPKAIGGR
jgi:phosphohistidine phosphatase